MKKCLVNLHAIIKQTGCNIEIWHFSPINISVHVGRAAAVCTFIDIYQSAQCCVPFIRVARVGCYHSAQGLPTFSPTVDSAQNCT